MILYIFLATLPSIILIITNYYNPKFHSTNDAKIIFKLVFIICVAIFSMRYDGVDYAVYKESFEAQNKLIPDQFYILLEEVVYSIGLGFNAILIFYAIVNIYSISVVSKYFNTSTIIVMAIYILHLFIIRDLSQFRIGISMAFMLIAITRKPYIRYFLYIIAVGFHASSLIFAIAHEIVKYTNKNQKVMVTLICGFIYIFKDVLFLALAGIDERVMIYINWDEPGYGASVSSFGSIILQLAVLVIASRNLLYQKNEINRMLFWMQFYGVLCYLIFHDIAIFSNRFGSILTSLYPYIISIRLTDVENNKNVSRNSILNYLYDFCLIICLTILVLKGLTDSVVQDVKVIPPLI